MSSRRLRPELMAQVVLYSAQPCPYCTFAKRLLEARGVAYDERDLTGDFEQRMRLIERTGKRTVPQIFFGDHLVGGYDELAALDRSGELMPLLKEHVGGVD
jgi:glutaredoxin 3